MRGKVWQWLEIAFGLLALTLLTLACHAMWPDKDGVAAWFQAIGSVAGIGIAIYIPWRQRADQARAEELRQLEARTVRLARLGLIALETESYAMEVIHSATPREDAHLMFGMLPNTGIQLVERLTELQDQGLHLLQQDICFRMRSALDKLNTQIKKCHGTAMPPGPSSGDPWGLRAFAQKVLDAASPVSRLEEEARDAFNAVKSHDYLPTEREWYLGEPRNPPGQ
jgi:hypothetical protein